MNSDRRHRNGEDASSLAKSPPQNPLHLTEANDIKEEKDTDSSQLHHALHLLLQLASLSTKRYQSTLTAVNHVDGEDSVHGLQTQLDCSTVGDSDETRVVLQLVQAIHALQARAVVLDTALQQAEAHHKNPQEKDFETKVANVESMIETIRQQEQRIGKLEASNNKWRLKYQHARQQSKELARRLLMDDNDWKQAYQVQSHENILLRRRVQSADGIRLYNEDAESSVGSSSALDEPATVRLESISQVSPTYTLDFSRGRPVGLLWASWQANAEHAVLDARRDLGIIRKERNTSNPQYVCVAGFRDDFDANSNLMPAMGARLVAINNQSMEGWTVEQVYEILREYERAESDETTFGITFRDDNSLAAAPKQAMLRDSRKNTLGSSGHKVEESTKSSKPFSFSFIRGTSQRKRTGSSFTEASQLSLPATPVPLSIVTTSRDGDESLGPKKTNDLRPFWMLGSKRSGQGSRGRVSSPDRSAHDELEELAPPNTSVPDCIDGGKTSKNDPRKSFDGSLTENFASEIVDNEEVLASKTGDAKKSSAPPSKPDFAFWKFSMKKQSSKESDIPIKMDVPATESLVEPHRKTDERTPVDDEAALGNKNDAGTDDESTHEDDAQHVDEQSIVQTKQTSTSSVKPKGPAIDMGKLFSNPFHKNKA